MRQGRFRQDGVAHLAVVAACAVLVVAALVGVVDRRARQHVVEAHFWFDGVTFDLAGGEASIGGMLDEGEQRHIRALAFAELRQAYEGVRVAFVDVPGGTYRIRVLQEFPPRRGPANPAGVARPMGPLGGEAAVNFRAVAALALYHAPPGAGRAAVVDGIARGLGRTAAHELAHLLLAGRGAAGHADPQSYEFESPDRPEQYYGSLRWGAAWPLLLERFGAGESARKDRS